MYVAFVDSVREGVVTPPHTTAHTAVPFHLAGIHRAREGAIRHTDDTADVRAVAACYLTFVMRGACAVSAKVA